MNWFATWSTGRLHHRKKNISPQHLPMRLYVCIGRSSRTKSIRQNPLATTVESRMAWNPQNWMLSGTSVEGLKDLSRLDSRRFKNLQVIRVEA